MNKKGSKLIGHWADYMTLPFDHTHDLDLGVSRSESEIALSQEWDGRLTWNKKDVSHPFMNMILTSVTMVGWADVPVTDRGDFRRCAVDISSFLTSLMFKAIHGIAPTCLSDHIVINFDVNGYDTRGSDMELYLPTLHKDMYRNSFMYMGVKLWNDLPEYVQHSTSIESFKQNYKMYKLIISSWHVCLFGNLSVPVLCNYYSFTL